MSVVLLLDGQGRAVNRVVVGVGYAPPAGFTATPDDGRPLWRPPQPAGVVSGAAFLALFTPSETAALWAADPQLMRGAMKVMAQGSANLASAECAQLMNLAVARGALVRARADQVLAGVEL